METKLNSPKITTLTVEISVIKIGNKQMTISVFNQLHTGVCFDENNNIIYPIWGRVNMKGVEYVIFQQGYELKKMRMIEEYTLYSYGESLVKSIKYYSPNSAHFTYNMGHIHTNIYEKLTLNKTDIIYELESDMRIINQIQESDFITSFKSKHARIINLAKKHLFNTNSKKDINFIESGLPKDTIKLIKDEYRENRSITEGYNQMVNEIKKSPQLFIAI